MFFNECTRGSPTGTCAFCKQPYVFDINVGQCVQCSAGGNCGLCNPNGKYCIACKIGFYYSDDNTCNACKSDCAECNIDRSSGTSKVVCQRCKDPETWYDPTLDRCVSCGWNGDPDPKVPRPCAACVPNPSNPTCLICNAGWRLGDDNKTCVTCDRSCANCYDNSTCVNCAVGYWRDNQNNCVTCNDGCLTCNVDSKTCSLCDDGYYLDPITQNCNKCTKNCYRCNTDGSCLECNQNSYFVPETQLCVKTISDKCA
jgi:hypothetical protein